MMGTGSERWPRTIEQCFKALGDPLGYRTIYARTAVVDEAMRSHKFAAWNTPQRAADENVVRIIEIAGSGSFMAPHPASLERSRAMQ
jgi:hypothetical protein